MKVVIHQHVRVNPGAEAFPQLGQQFQELEPIGIIAKNRFAFVAAGGGVVATAGPFDA